MIKRLFLALSLFVCGTIPAFALSCQSGFSEIKDLNVFDATTGKPFAGSLQLTMTYNSVNGTTTIRGSQQTVSFQPYSVGR